MAARIKFPKKRLRRDAGSGGFCFHHYTILQRRSTYYLLNKHKKGNIDDVGPIAQLGSYFTQSVEKVSLIPILMKNLKILNYETIE